MELLRIERPARTRLDRSSTAGQLDVATAPSLRQVLIERSTAGRAGRHRPRRGRVPRLVRARRARRWAEAGPGTHDGESGGRLPRPAAAPVRADPASTEILGWSSAPTPSCRCRRPGPGLASAHPTSIRPTVAGASGWTSTSARCERRRVRRARARVPGVAAAAKRPVADVRRFADVRQRDDLVLDAGCGPANDLRLLRDAGVHPVGVDLSLGALREARMLLPRHPLVQAPLQDLPFRRARSVGCGCRGPSPTCRGRVAADLRGAARPTSTAGRSTCPATGARATWSRSTTRCSARCPRLRGDRGGGRGAVRLARPDRRHRRGAARPDPRPTPPWVVALGRSPR
jgi:SAM-dependent methyltransferase